MHVFDEKRNFHFFCFPIFRYSREFPLIMVRDTIVISRKLQINGDFNLSTHPIGSPFVEKVSHIPYKFVQFLGTHQLPFNEN